MGVMATQLDRGAITTQPDIRVLVTLLNRVVLAALPDMGVLVTLLNRVVLAALLGNVEKVGSILALDAITVLRTWKLGINRQKYAGHLTRTFHAFAIRNKMMPSVLWPTLFELVRKYGSVTGPLDREWDGVGLLQVATRPTPRGTVASLLEATCTALFVQASKYPGKVRFLGLIATAILSQISSSGITTAAKELSRLLEHIQ
mmetsp:Transcript_3990/g.9481  ORF Transcript_3990/g.9481 Transcript_3990/m.9481 type:complete len:202 (+) Transcript_3990:390-995(+)